MKHLLLAFLTAASLTGCSTTNYVWPESVDLAGNYLVDFTVTARFDEGEPAVFEFPETTIWVAKDARTPMLNYFSVMMTCYASHAESAYFVLITAYAQWFGILERIDWDTYADKKTADLHARVTDTTLDGKVVGSATWDYALDNFQPDPYAPAEGASNAASSGAFVATIGGQRYEFSDRAEFKAFAAALIPDHGDPLHLIK